MKTTISALIGVLVLLMSQPAGAQTASASGAASDRETIPITQLIAAVARKTGKKFVVGPKVQADVTIIGQNTSNISYGELLTILQVHGFIATEGGGYVRVMPDTLARVLASQPPSGKENRADAEFVNRVIQVKTMPAAMLVPILRPLLPQHAHLAAVNCSNTLLMVDTYANLKRIDALVQALDVGTPFQPEKCVTSPNPTPGSGITNSAKSGSSERP